MAWIPRSCSVLTCTAPRFAHAQQQPDTASFGIAVVVGQIKREILIAREDGSALRLLFGIERVRLVLARGSIAS